MDAETEKARRHQLQRIGDLARRGMTEERAELLASTPDLDLDTVIAALDAGCDPDTAWRIWNTEPARPRKRRR